MRRIRSMTTGLLIASALLTWLGRARASLPGRVTTPDERVVAEGQSGFVMDGRAIAPATPRRPGVERPPAYSQAAERTPAGRRDAPGPEGDPRRGATLYTKYGCYQCHGRVGQGGAAGPRLGPPPIAFSQFVRALRRPNQMPPYSERVLSEDEIVHIYAFVRALPRPPSVGALSIVQ